MIPRVAKGGRSFKGAFKYYMHDKDALTRERIEWTHTLNMITQDPDKAWKVMSYTAISAERLKEYAGIKKSGRKLEKPVFSYSLSWHPEQTPDKNEMLEAAQRSIEALDMQEHEALIVAHRDEEHPHCHIILNRVHPQTGRAASNSHTYRKLSEFALQLEMDGERIYCPQRKDNHQMREQGLQTKYKDLNITNAWESSFNGQDFMKALREKGYQLAQGRKRIVVVDPHGKIHNPKRHLGEKVRAKHIHEKLADLDPSKLPDANELAGQVELLNQEQQRQEQHYDERSIELTNDMQDRHIDERSQLQKKHFEIIRRESNKLKKFYDFEAKEQDIIQLEKKCTRPPWWRKLFGLAKRDRAMLSTLKANHKNATWRYDERIGHLENKRDRAIDKLEAKQEKEKLNLRILLQQRRPSKEPDTIIQTIERQKDYTHQNTPKPRAPGLSL